MSGIEVERLSLSLPGLTEDQGRYLASRIAEGLANRSLQEDGQRRGRIRLATRMRPGTSLAELAEQIVSDLVSELERTA